MSPTIMPSMAKNINTRLRRHLDGLLEDDHAQKFFSYLPPLNFITLHYAYFILTSIIASAIFYGTSRPSQSISYTDSLFLIVSAMTEAGLNTVNLSTLTTFQQVILFLLILAGSQIFVSIATVLARKRVFESRFKHIVKRQKDARRSHRREMSESRELVGTDGVGGKVKTVNNPRDTSGFESRHSIPRDPIPVTEHTPSQLQHRSASVDSASTRTAEAGDADVDVGREAEVHYAASASSVGPGGHGRVLSFVGVGGSNNNPSAMTSSREKFSTAPDGIYNRGRKKEVEVPGQEEPLNHSEYPNYLTRHTTGRNAQFFGLSKAEREHLGGVEYRAITLLAYIVPAYFILWQLIGCMGIAAYMAHNKGDVARQNGINPWWLGIFNGASAFNNSGMSLLDANMIPFQTSIYVLITMGLLILAGNTAYPLFLRLIIWSLLKIMCLIYPSDDQYTDHKATLRFILTYPRRVYTNLFPTRQTWWLLFMVVCLNGIDWAAFELLNIGNRAVEAIPSRFRVLDGLFQALAVRSGGFYIISIPSLRIGLQVLYVIMMYISVYPVVITMRHSNVYEERSLGIYADDSSPADLESAQPPKLGAVFGKLRKSIATTFSYPFPSAPVKNEGTSTQFIRQQIRGQLAHDLWWLVLAILFISCIEVSNFERDPVTYSVFNVIFEVVSAYGCVGISTGLPNEAYSFSGGWHISSKLILIAVMLRGRHRGLPVALDRAVRLPHGEAETELEEEDQGLRRSISRSVGPGERGVFGASPRI